MTNSKANSWQTALVNFGKERAKERTLEVTVALSKILADHKELIKAKVSKIVHQSVAGSDAKDVSVRFMPSRAEETVPIHSLSQLRKYVPCRFSSLRDRWVKAGLPLKFKSRGSVGSGMTNNDFPKELPTSENSNNLEMLSFSEQPPGDSLLADESTLSSFERIGASKRLGELETFYSWLREFGLLANDGLESDDALFYLTVFKNKK